MDLVTGLITLGSGLITAFAGMGSSPSEEAIRALIKQLDEKTNFLSSTAFSKEELLNVILPQVQAAFRSGASVAAGAVGATVPEIASGVPSGQAFMDLYLQSSAPVIAKGESQSAQAYQSFVQFYGQLDAAAKSRTLQAFSLKGQLVQGLPQQTGVQKFLTNFLQGANIGSTIKGNVDLAGALSNQATSVTDIQKMLFNGDESVMQKYQNFLKIYQSQGNDGFQQTLGGLVPK